MTLHCARDPRRRGSQPGVDQRDEGDPELRWRPSLFASGEGGVGFGSHPPSLGTGGPSAEVAVDGRW
jgi:hypothetical protein